MSRKRSSALIFIVLGLLPVMLFSSCQKEPSIQSVTPESLIGTWKVNGGPGAYKTVEFLGSREFKIDSEGDKNPDILGYYQLVNGQMIFNDKGGLIIPECGRDGVYIPELRGNQLSFQLVRDECSGRLEAIKHIWRKTS